MLEQRATHTKVLATLGPASAGPRRISDMVRGGVDGFRINMSHGTAEERARLVKLVHGVRKELQRPVSLVIDLRGPRLRLGSLEEPRTLTRGEEVVLIAGRRAAGGAIPVDYARLASEIAPRQRVLIRDGRAELRVTAIKGRAVHCRVVRGAEILSNQGVNLPDTDVRAPALSKKDLADLAFAVEHDADWIAMSFVRGPEDLRAVRRALARHGAQIAVIAKIERPEAVKNLDAVLAESDGAMVARGDLAVEMGHEVVPLIQKRIISRCIEMAVPVIIATQMMESMIESSQPTRAEVSDVANAVYDCADAVMLSGETAVGKFPVRAARTMHRIISRTEKALLSAQVRRREAPHRTREGEMSVELATVNAAVQAARNADARLILAFTESGRSARLVASFRSNRPQVGLTSNERSFHRMALYWGVRPALMQRVRSVREMYQQAARTLERSRWVRPSDLLVGITGTFSVSGATNTIRVMPLSESSSADSAPTRKTVRKKT